MSTKGTLKRELEGSTHHALISVKEMFTSSENTGAVIDEAIRGEAKLIDITSL